MKRTIMLLLLCSASVAFAFGELYYTVGGIEYKYEKDRAIALNFSNPNTVIPASVSLPFDVFNIDIMEDITEWRTCNVVGTRECMRAPKNGVLKTLVFNGDVDLIGDYSFAESVNLESVSMKNVYLISGAAFYNCANLSTVEWGRVGIIEDFAFMECSKLKKWSWPSQCYIGQAAFSGTGIEQVRIPADVEFDSHVLGDCKALTNAVFETGVTAVPDGIFAGCSQLKDVELPMGISSIGYQAFQECERLKEIEFPETIREIGDDAFHSDKALVNINIPNSLSKIGAGAFALTALTNVDLSHLSIDRIADETFLLCADLKSIKLPPSVKEIGDEAFSHSAITNGDFSNLQIEKVGERAFAFCDGIKHVVFPETLQELGFRAVYDLSYGGSITVEFRGPPPKMSEDVFTIRDEWRNGMGKYDPKYEEAWQLAIKEWDAAHGTSNEWHGLKFLPIVEVEPVDWEMNKPKAGDQTLTVSWHVPTNDNLTVEQAMAELKAKNLTYAVWRSGDDPKEYADFRKSVCVAQNVVDVKWPDEKFGDIKGTHPVRYWVEIQEEKNAKGDPSNRKRPNAEPVFCTTRRRFGLAVGVSTYGEGMKETPVGGFVADTRKFVSMLESSYDGCKIDEILDLHATVENISQRIRALPFENNGKKRIVPGDMVFLWIATHGGEDGSIAAYNGYYGNSVSSVYNTHDTAMNVTSCLRSDLSWVGGEPGVRVVCLFPFCHSRAVWQGFDSFLNCAFIGATRKIDVSVLDNLKTQFGTYFLGYGVAKGLANLSGISGSPYADLGEDGFDVPPHVCNSQSGNTVTLDELGRYAKSLAFGASWKKRARAVVERPELLSTIIMAEGCMAVKGNVPGLPELSPHETDSGIINLHYKLPKGCTSAIFWFREKRESAEWHWFTLDFAASDARRFGRDVGVLEWIWEVSVNDRKPFVPFGTQTQEERTYRGVVRPDTEYEFALQGVNEFGYGVTRHIRVPYRTGADLPMVAREVFVREFREMRNYLGRLNKKGINASVCITPDGDFWTICLSLDENGSPVEYIGRASRNDISDNGVMKVNVSCKTKALKFSANSASAEIALPNSFDLNVSIDGVEGANSDFGLSCIPVAEVGFDEYAACPGVQFQVDPPVSSLLGEVSYSAKSLPKGLSIDSSSGVISGIPTVPGSYVVLVTVKSKTDPTQTETIEVPIVIGNYVDETIVVDDEYGPFVPGEEVELRFPEGAAWKVTGLPTGLKWDAKLPGVTGVPTKPGTNTVTFTWTDASVKPAVEHKASSTFIVGPLPVLSVQVAGEGTGKVTGAGAYAANKKVTLKATADTKDAAAKGKNPATVKSVFAGWYDAAGDLVAQTPSLSYVMPPYDVTLQARFIPASNDWATADCVTEAGSVWVVTNETKVVLAPISVAAAGGSLPTVKVAGLPSGLKFTTKDIMKKNPKTEVDIPANTIYGTPTKGGVYNATVTVTTAGKASVVRAIKFIIRTASDYVADADWDPVQGKVTGAGVYQAGKKVTLKATANKGYVFAGWYEGEGLVSQAASYALTMPTNDVAYEARFVTAEEDKASIAAGVNGMSFGVAAESGGSTASATNVMCGVYLEWPVAASALSETTVKVAGLPSGLKFTAKPITSKVTSGTGSSRVTTVVTNVAANTIYGAPTAASKTAKNPATGLMTVKPSEVKVTVTTAGKNSQVYQIDTTVDPLPAWAVGTFAGPSHEEGLDEGDVVVTQTNGAATVTVAASGKITAKQPVDGKATSFAANYFDAYDGEFFWATLTAKVGKEVVTNEMAVSGRAGRVTLSDGSEAVVTNGVINADRFDAWQCNWKVEPWKTIGKTFDKREVTYEEDGVKVALKFSANGTAKVAGEFATYDKDGNVVVKNGKPVTVKASGSATLLPTVGEDGETRYLVFVYLAPKGLPPHARCLEIPNML